VEDVDGRLSISKRSPTIEKKYKEADEYDRHKMGYSRQKGTWNNMTMLAMSIAFNISEEMTTNGLMFALTKPYEKPLFSNKVFLMKCLFNMKMLEGGYVVDDLNEFNMVTS